MPFVVRMVRGLNGLLETYLLKASLHHLLHYTLVKDSVFWEVKMCLVKIHLTKGSEYRIAPIFQVLHIGWQGRFSLRNGLTRRPARKDFVLQRYLFHIIFMFTITAVSKLILIDGRVCKLILKTDTLCSKEMGASGRLQSLVAVPLGSSCPISYGKCTGPCPKCESSLQYQVPTVYGPFFGSVCISSNELNESSCLESNGMWSVEFGICYSQPWQIMNSNFCEQGFVLFNCSQLSLFQCQNQTNPGANISIRILDFVVNNQQCFWNSFASCDDKSTCENSGWCNDWAYKSSDGPVCRIPWTAGENGAIIDLDTCNSTKFNKSLNVHALLSDACIVSPLSYVECSALNGTEVWQALTRDQCESRQACFLNTFQITNLTHSECEHLCDSSLYKWRSIYRWQSSIWTVASFTPGVWKMREMVPENRWAKAAVPGRVTMAIETAVVSSLADPYVSESLCRMNPLMGIFLSVACACNLPSVPGTPQKSCNIEGYMMPTILQAKIFSGSEWTFRSGTGTISGFYNNNKSLSVNYSVIAQVELIAFSELMSSFALNEISCVPYEVVTVSGNTTNVVGQIIGPALLLTGLGDGDNYFCLQPDETIFTCLDKYTVADFGFLEGTDIIASNTSVVQDLMTGTICGWLNRTYPSRSNVVSAVPIMRTSNFQPYQVYQGPSVQITTSLTLSSKALFNDVRRSAFLKAMAASISTALPLKDVSIVQVCDASGCSVRRAGMSANVTTVATKVENTSILCGIG